MVYRQKNRLSTYETVTPHCDTDHNQTRTMTAAASVGDAMRAGQWRLDADDAVLSIEAFYATGSNHLRALHQT